MWRHHFILIYLALFVCDQNHVWTFNVETHNYAIYKGEDKAMFGYAVAEYRDQSHRGWVIVGAPLNRTEHRNLTKAGAVFRCDIAEDNRCFPIEFDRNSVDYVRSVKSPDGKEPIDEKSYQWFGATISASMEDGGPILACAPKYHWFGYIKANWSVAGLKDVVGACWLTNLNDGSSIEYSPCRNNDTAGHHRQGMCQAGIGAAITKDGKRLFIGAPGSWYWQGQLFTIESNVSLPFVPDKIAHASGRNVDQVRLLTTKEGPAYEDNSYLGYSVAVGDFLGNDDSGVAVGVPRGADLYGKVLLFTSQLFNHQNITGEQMGAYFGYALAVNDVDGDRLDDLIITAPFYTQPEDAGVKIETGRIYVFYQGGGTTPYQKFHYRDGVSNRGHFGLSVSSLGDINRDGYGDFVIGEPYGGEENRGAVYIYHGSKEGVEEKYSQVIYSENLEQPLRTFGWSVSGGLDLDGNQYTDMVVGAYESSAATYFRSRPVINMYSEINFLNSTINLMNKACVLSDGTAVACSELKMCCMYEGIGSWSQYDFTIHVSLDEKKRKNPRLFFLDFENKSLLNWTIPVTKNQNYCRQMKVYVGQHLRDKLTSLDAEMNIELTKDSVSHSRYLEKRDPKKKLMAILGPKNTKKRDALTIQKNCGSDNVCVPDLVMKVQKNVEKYLLGSNKILELEVAIQNIGEDAFESIFYLQLPVGIDYINIESETESNEIIIHCSAPKTSNNNTLRCDVGNPLPEGKLVKFKIFLEPITFHDMKPSYDLKMKVNSTNPEKRHTLGNNNFDISLPVWIETDLFIEGESKPKTIDFNSLDYANTDLNLLTNTLEFGPVLTHNYTIRNNGPSTVINIDTNLIWTAETFTGDVLLYLMDQPEISNEKVRCDSANADYLNLKNRKARSIDEDDTLLQSFTKTLFAEPSSNSKHITVGRNSRQTGNHSLPENKQMDDEDSVFNSEFLCKSAQCVNLLCRVGPLEKNEEVSIAARYRVNVKSVKKITESEEIRVSTKLLAVVTAQPFIGEPTERVMRSSEVSTQILPAKETNNNNDDKTFWIIVFSAVAGTLILLLLIFLLYKCGFFKRNRPSAAPEREPLNTAG